MDICPTDESAFESPASDTAADMKPKQIEKAIVFFIIDTLCWANSANYADVC
jgi:hypothetical protein